MLTKPTRKRILNKKLLDQANPYADLSRIKIKSNQAIKDLTLIAKEMDERQLQEIFTAEKLVPLVIAILDPRNKRTIDVAEMLANRVFQKLSNELPATMIDTLGSDIGKTWTYAKIASEYWGKPLLGK